MYACVCVCVYIYIYIRTYSFRIWKSVGSTGADSCFRGVDPPPAADGWITARLTSSQITSEFLHPGLLIVRVVARLLLLCGLAVQQTQSASQDLGPMLRDIA